MRSPGYPTAGRFQKKVANLLQLPSGSGDAEVRDALLAKGVDFLTWYNTRLQAIANLKRSPRRRGERVTRAH